MTLPRASVMEWTVSYGRDSAMAKRDLAALKITYLPLGPEAEKPAKYSSTSFFVRSGLPRDRGYMILR